MTQPAPDFDFSQLSVPERLELIDRIRESIETGDAAVGLNKEQSEELLRRDDLVRTDASRLVPWVEAERWLDELNEVGLEDVQLIILGDLT